MTHHNFTGMPVFGWHTVLDRDFITTDGTFLSPYHVQNLANPATYLGWYVDDGSDHYVEITTNYTGTIDYLAVASHSMFNTGILIGAQGDSGSGYVTVRSDDDFEDNGPWMKSFDSPSSPSIYSKIKVTFKNGFPFTTVLYVGKYLQFQRSIVVSTRHQPITMSESSKVTTGKSEQGNFLGRVRTSHKQVSTMEFEHIDLDWFRTTLQPALVQMQSTPFFCIWDPSETDDVGYCWLIEDPKPEIDPVTRRVALKLVMEGYTTYHFELL